MGIKQSIKENKRIHKCFENTKYICEIKTNFVNNKKKTKKKSPKIN